MNIINALHLISFPFQDSEISADRHALIVPPFMGNGNRVHPMPYTDASTPCKLHILVFDVLNYFLCRLS